MRGWRAGCGACSLEAMSERWPVLALAAGRRDLDRRRSATRGRSRCGSRSWSRRCGHDRRLRGERAVVAMAHADRSRGWVAVLLVDLGPWALLHLPRGDTAAFYPVFGDRERCAARRRRRVGPWRASGEDLAVYPSLLSGLWASTKCAPANPLAPRDYARVLYSRVRLLAGATVVRSRSATSGIRCSTSSTCALLVSYSTPPGGARLPSGAADARSHRCRGARHLSPATQRRRAAAYLPADRSGRDPRRSDRRLGGAHARSAPGGAVQDEVGGLAAGGAPLRTRARWRSSPGAPDVSRCA